jgi:type VI secretion system secreted protein VgrG
MRQTVSRDNPLPMKNNFLIQRFSICTVVAVMLLAAGPAAAQLMGTAGSYGVLGSSTVANTGSTVIHGDFGVSPGTAVTGFFAIDGGPGLFTGTANLGNAASAQARADAMGAYSTLAGLGGAIDLSGQDLGGMTLLPGVYRFTTSAQLTGALTLDTQGDINARFVFQIGSTLTTASNSRVNLLNVSLSYECGPDAGLYWQVGSSATLGTGTAFAGNILASDSITLTTGASIDFGRALALNGAVTLDNNRIDASDIDGGFCVTDIPGITPVPEPATYGIVGAGLVMFAAWRRRRATLSSRSTP